MALIDKVIHYWRFFTDNNTQPDSVGSNDLTVDGATFTTSGKIDNAYSFVTNDSMVNANNLFVGSAGSLSFWIKYNNSTGDRDIPIGSQDLTDARFDFVFARQTSGILTAYVNATSVSTSSSTLLNDTDWHFIVITHVANSTKLYLDNVLVVTGNIYSGTLSSGTSFLVGKDINDSAYFDGTITEIGIYDDELTVDEVAEGWNSGAGITYPFVVVTTPVAEFSGDDTTIFASESVQFTDESTNTPTSWSWVFEGGTPSTSSDENPLITYDSAGTFDVTLTATNDAGNDEEIKVDYITVTPAPVAAFSADSTTIQVDGSVQFTDSSTNSPASWSWVFEGGNPSTSTDQNPSVTYNSGGLFNVSLQATNPAGSDDEVKFNYITVLVEDNYVEAKRKELKTDWPITKGLTARTTTQKGRVMNLIPENSVIPKRLKVGIR